MNRKVLITGGSRGIGAACVRAFSQKGDRVIFIYRANEESAKKISDETGAYMYRADISIPEEARAATLFAAEQLGGIDILVNCAGIAQFALFTDISDNDWKHMIDSNLTSAFICSREAAISMIAQKSGRIINIGSVWGRLGASCEVHYSASKAGLRGLTSALSKELGPSNITVNCIEPGVIDTDMNAMLDDSAIAELIDSTPLCRIGKPEDVAAAVLFLASDEASFITNCILPVDGGFPV